MRKNIIDSLFIIIATVILLIINHYKLMGKTSAFALIPILIAYYLGQLSERKIT